MSGTVESGPPEKHTEWTIEDDDPTRATILQVTLGLLEERGYAAVTTDLIAAEAQVSKTTIYRYWRTKQEAVIDAIRLKLFPLDVPELGSTEKEIRWILEHRLEDYRNPGTLRLVGSLVGASTSDPQFRPLFDEWIDRLGGAIRQVIQRGIRRGDVREEIDTAALETLIAGVVARTVVMQHSYPEETVDHIIELLRMTFQPDSPQEEGS